MFDYPTRPTHTPKHTHTHTHTRKKSLCVTVCVVLENRRFAHISTPFLFVFFAFPILRSVNPSQRLVPIEVSREKKHLCSEEMWDWKDDDYALQLDVSNSLWNDVRENNDGLSYMFDETTTPVKSCGDLAYQVTNNENANKGMETCREMSSQSKRRRMLHFDDEGLDADVLPLCDEDLSSNFLKSKEKVVLLDDAFADMAQWVSGFADDMSVSGSGYDGLDQSSEGWLADCLVNDSGMHFSLDDMNLSGTSDIRMQLTDSSNSQPKNQGNMVQEHAPTRQNIIFKGKKSFIKTPTKMTSSVVLPFAFVKPCGEGAVTLKDINQKILTPPPSKSKATFEDPELSYPTSAFSGKPIVGKTKIRTEGGKGSITIMRTKG
ncbi:hypothetical protein L1987_03962 [Smallanthus sonchifolius]|uniref:Uncharacterized protein n=1 Tax=Smallanthus sonchifolius TaxID=185202 RepID=A0ACB9KC54_9ASTR|nr:hypothetical protein L1987_03962 [Smallanthus sonchifolius]